MVLSQKYILLFLLVAFCFADCKKYPEGPLISFQTKVKRVLGDYNVEAFLVDGIDSTSQLTCLKYRFYKSDDKEQLLISPDCLYKYFDGDWEFENHKKELKIFFTHDTTAKTPFPSTRQSGGPLISSYLSWNIQRLTKNQMWLKVEYGEKEYYIKFKKT